MQEKHVLLTNIRAVGYGDLNLDVNAIVISRSFLGNDTDARIQVRGFGPDPGWPVFDLHLKSIEYELEDVTPVMQREDERFFVNGHRQYASTKLTLADGTELTLYHEEPEFELDVQVFEEHRDQRPILKVWDELVRKVAKYWTAPGMPVLCSMPVEAVREAARHGSDTLRNFLRSRLM